jgi:hypothetical protein
MPDEPETPLFLFLGRMQAFPPAHSGDFGPWKRRSERNSMDEEADGHITLDVIISGVNLPS